MYILKKNPAIFVGTILINEFKNFTIHFLLFVWAFIRENKTVRPREFKSLFFVKRTENISASFRSKHNNIKFKCFYKH